jgi:hypothetical protein
MTKQVFAASRTSLELPRKTKIILRLNISDKSHFFMTNSKLNKIERWFDNNEYYVNFRCEDFVFYERKVNYVPQNALY